MSRPAVSILSFGLYLAIGGLLLVVMPQELCRWLDLRPPGDTMWVRLSGLYFLDLAFYCIEAALNEQTSFIRWSLKTRPLTIVFLGAFVVTGLENPSILLFGVVDLLATFWTAIALRASSRRGCEARSKKRWEADGLGSAKQGGKTDADSGIRRVGQACR